MQCATAKWLMSASLIGRPGSSAFRLSTNSSVDVAHGLSLLFGLGTKGPSIMGFEDEVEQSLPRPCRQFERQVQADMRTHLIHRPARDIIPPWGGARFPPIAFGPAQVSNRCDFPSPPERGAVNPNAVHDHGQPTCQRYEAWPAELVGVAQPATRRMQARTPLVLVAYIRSRRGA